MKVLIVDDEPLVRRSLKKVFERAGHDVVCAEDGITACELWPQYNPDLVFLDVLMPGMSGPQVLQEIKAQNNVKVVLMSAYSGDHDTRSAKELGADIFIAKPFDDIFNVVKIGEGLFNELCS